jgi:hypothetical protein
VGALSIRTVYAGTHPPKGNLRLKNG